MRPNKYEVYVNMNIQNGSNNSSQSLNMNLDLNPNYKNLDSVYVSENIQENITFINKLFEHSHDIILKDLYIGQPAITGAIVYFDGMVDKEIIHDQIVRLDLINTKELFENGSIKIDIIRHKFATVSEVMQSSTFKDLVYFLLNGYTLMFINFSKSALIIKASNMNSRQIEEPSSEKTIKGPRDGFVENIITNITLVRRRIKDPNLAVEFINVGRRSQTTVAIVYINGVINPEIPKEIKKRISKIDTDGIIDSAQIEQLVEKHKWTIFPQVLATERPDKATLQILEGRLAVIVDGTPFVSIFPTTFDMFLNSTDDHYERSIISSAIRLVRYSSLVIATNFPALFIALTAYHPGMIPTALALTITGTRVGLPFPLFLEILIMEASLDILQEAAIRLPRLLSQTISILGGLIIGQASVQAGIVSPIIVVIVSITAISSFTFPVYSITLGIRIVRILLMFAATLLGLYGIVMLWLVILIHMASIEDFNIRYLSGYSPYTFQLLRDMVLKAPKGFIRRRPEYLKTEDISTYKKRDGNQDAG
jgi:hypothetical protein